MSSLNPHAPEYKPIPPGVSPTLHSKLPTLLLPFTQLLPPFSAVYRHLPPPPPNFYSTQIFTYISSSSSSSSSPSRITPPPPPFYTSTNTYYVAPQIPNPSPPARVFCRSERGCPGQNRGIRAAANIRAEKIGRSRLNLNMKMNERNHDKMNLGNFGRQGKHKHEIVPLKRNENNTTIMIRNIPYDCPRSVLISMLDEFCTMENNKNGWREREESAYDFLYMPIDFETNNGRGFAFVNFTNASTVWKFVDAFHLEEWDFVDRNNWPKKIEIVSAKIQGKEALVQHFSGSTFECETDEFLPVCFDPPRVCSGQQVKLTVVGRRGGNYHRAAPNNHHNKGLKA